MDDKTEEPKKKLTPQQKQWQKLPAETISKFKQLLKSGLTAEQAARGAGISQSYMERRLRREIQEAETELRLEVFQALQQHIASNAPAAIFAAKAKLGWQDVTKIEQTTSVDYVDVPSNETKADWGKRQEKLRLVKAA